MMKIRPLFEIRASELKKRIEKRFLTAVLEPDRAVAAIIRDLGWDWQFQSAQPRP